LPGTGGLTRVVDKRKVRRDLADVFCTTAEGIKGRRAVEWRLVDGVLPRSRFQEAVRDRASVLASNEVRGKGPAVVLDPLDPHQSDNRVAYRYVTLAIHPTQRTARITVNGPETSGDLMWALRTCRELDDALLRLRFHYDEIGLVLLYTRGDLDLVRALDTALYDRREEWPASEILFKMARTLRRLDHTARSLFAVVDQGSCFAGSLLELALASDRTYMLRDSAGDVRVAVTSLNGGVLPMGHGISRLALRFLADPTRAERLLARTEPLDADAAEQAGLVTAAPDEIDWDDELRVAIEERASISPDALTGMEANLRFAGAENCDSKIFSRLSAWQNWIFSRPNAVGEEGALTLYGKPERPQFNWRRT